DTRKKTVRRRFRGYEGREPSNLDRGRPIRLRNQKNTFTRILRANHRVFGFRRQPDRANKFAVVYPVPQHEFILVLNAGVDEITEKPSFDAIVRLLRIVYWTVGHASTDQPMSVVAASGFVLAG